MSTVEERRKSPLVMVRWLDSMAYGRWEDGADLLRNLTEKDGGLEHLTVGWAIDENDTAIVLCGSRHTTADVWNDSMAIPKVAILERHLLAKVQP